MTALSALASAAIVPPADGTIPPALEAAVRQACAGAWRALEVVLAGDVLRGRLAKTRDTYVRDGAAALLDLFGNTGVRPEALAALRAARQDGVLDGALDLDAIVATLRAEGVAAAARTASASLRRALADHRDLDAVLGEPEIGSLLVDAARAVFRNAARDVELARWAIGPTGIPGRDRALTAFAELVGSPASVDELELLIALPIHLDENVQFTVYRPRSIDPGRWHPMLAFAHLAERRLPTDTADPVEEVRRQAELVLGDRAKGYQPVTQDAGSAIPAEGELTFVPEIRGIEFNPPRRSFLWLEPVHREEFRLRAGPELDGKTLRGRLTVFLGHIAIAEVGLSIRVDAVRSEPAIREPVRARTYRKIFASYSHRDIAIVNQFETYARALGDEYLRDWIHLRTGEVWNDRLRQLIEQADAFQLFWSWNAMGSKFVKQEYEHALALDRPSFVRPTYWEDPMPTALGLPPDALLRLHFQKIGGVLAAQEEASTRAAAAPRARATRPPTLAESEAMLEDFEPTAPLARRVEMRKQARRTPIGAVPAPRPPDTASKKQRGESPAPEREDVPSASLEITDPDLELEKSMDETRVDHWHDTSPVVADADASESLDSLAEPPSPAPSHSRSVASEPPAYAVAERSSHAPSPFSPRPAPPPAPAWRPAQSPASSPPATSPAPLSRPPAPSAGRSSRPSAPSRPAAPAGSSARSVPPAPSPRPTPEPSARPAEPLPSPLPSSPMPAPMRSGDARPKPPAKLPPTKPQSPPPMPAPPPEPMQLEMKAAPIIACERCGASNTSHLAFCLGCGAKLAGEPRPAGARMKSMAQAPSVVPEPSRPAAKAEKVSPYAATVQQPAYKSRDDLQSKEAEPSEPEPPSAAASRWLALAIILVVLVAAAIVLYMLAA